MPPSSCPKSAPRPFARICCSSLDLVCASTGPSPLASCTSRKRLGGGLGLSSTFQSKTPKKHENFGRILSNSHGQLDDMGGHTKSFLNSRSYWTHWMETEALWGSNRIFRPISMAKHPNISMWCCWKLEVFHNIRQPQIYCKHKSTAPPLGFLYALPCQFLDQASCRMPTCSAISTEEMRSNDLSLVSDSLQITPLVAPKECLKQRALLLACWVWLCFWSVQPGLDA